MSRTPKEIADSLYASFDQSSEEFRYELYPYNKGDVAYAKQYVDMALSVIAAAMGPDQKEVVAAAGLSREDQEDPRACELVVLTDSLLFHSHFPITGGKRPVVKVIPRNTVKSLTIQDAPAYTKPQTPLGLKFTVEYQDGLVLDFPLKKNIANDASNLGDILDAVRTDLMNLA